MYRGGGRCPTEIAALSGRRSLRRYTDDSDRQSPCRQIRRLRLWPPPGAAMIRSRLSPSVSLISFAAALTAAGCSESRGEDALQLGSTGQALRRDDGGRGERGRPH